MNNLITVSGNTTALTGSTEQKLPETLNRNMFHGYQRKHTGNTGTQNTKPKKRVLPQAELTIKPLRTFFQELGEIQEPRNYFGELIPQGELTILFGRSNVGKSFLAYQIGEAIASGRNVFSLVKNDNSDNNQTTGYNLNNECQPEKILYADFEGTPKKICRRYSYYEFHENFICAFAKKHCVQNPLDFIDIIEEAVKKENIKVVIIDNISAISTDTETTANAIILMNRIKDLQESNELTLILMAHTPKIQDAKPIYWTDLAGSSKLFGLTENVIAINTAEFNRSIRYIKQFKTRYDEKNFEAENVIAMNFGSNNNGFKGFEFLAFESEDELLRIVERGTINNEKEQIINLTNLGISPKDIAIKLKDEYAPNTDIAIYRTTVRQIIHLLRKEGKLPPYEPKPQPEPDKIQEFLERNKEYLNENPEPQDKNCDDKNSENQLKNTEKTVKNTQKTVKNEQKTCKNDTNSNTELEPENNITLKPKQMPLIHKTRIIGTTELRRTPLSEHIKPIQRDTNGSILDSEFASPEALQEILADMKKYGNVNDSSNLLNPE